MATENLKSTQITALDANPVTNGGLDTGGGSGGIVYAKVASGVTGTTAVTGGTYQMVRIPSNCHILQILVWLDAAVTTFTADIGLTYSTSHLDGTKQSNVADVVSGTTGPNYVNSDHDFFASAVALAAIVTPTDYAFEQGEYTAANRIKPLWQACGLSSDPGGFFDITLTLTATASGAAVPNMLVYYCQ